MTSLWPLATLNAQQKKQSRCLARMVAWQGSLRSQGCSPWASVNSRHTMGALYHSVKGCLPGWKMASEATSFPLPNPWRLPPLALPGQRHQGKRSQSCTECGQRWGRVILSCGYPPPLSPSCEDSGSCKELQPKLVSSLSTGHLATGPAPSSHSPTDKGQCL